MGLWNSGIFDGTAGWCGTQWAVAKTPRTLPSCLFTVSGRRAISGTRCSENFLLVRRRPPRRLLLPLLQVRLCFCCMRYTFFCLYTVHLSRCALVSSGKKRRRKTGGGGGETFFSTNDNAFTRHETRHRYQWNCGGGIIVVFNKSHKGCPLRN